MAGLGQQIAIGFAVLGLVFACTLIVACMATLSTYGGLIGALGALTVAGVTAWNLNDLTTAVGDHPGEPEPPDGEDDDGDDEVGTDPGGGRNGTWNPLLGGSPDCPSDGSNSHWNQIKSVRAACRWATPDSEEAGSNRCQLRRTA